MTEPWWWSTLGALAGAIIGSFVATLVVRWPAGRTLGGRSQCDGCSMPLRWFELVPILSAVVQSGRCRRCAAPIDRQHMVIELLCASVGAVALWRFPGLYGASGAVFGWLLVALAALDLAHFWLPDRLTATVAVLGGAGGIAGLSPMLGDRLIGGVAGFGMLALIAFSYRQLRGREGLGAGDPKLLGAIGLWTGWQALPFVVLGASLTGLAVAAVLAVRGTVTAQTRLPLGTLLAAAAFPVWVFVRDWPFDLG